MAGTTRPTGQWGDLSTQSFYPPHHLTLGEGGAVNIVHDPLLKTIVESFRDWGRDCWCPSGKDNTCGKRFAWQLGELPEGYDHKYVYSHLGYNLKPLDVQAAIVAQTLRLAAIGLAVGAAASWALARSLSGLLFGITPGDPMTFLAMLVALAIVATLAGYLPARRASRIDPLIALRAE